MIARAASKHNSERRGDGAHLKKDEEKEVHSKEVAMRCVVMSMAVALAGAFAVTGDGGPVEIRSTRTDFAEKSVPHKINYQGYLTDALGNPTDDTLQMAFSIWDSQEGGAQLWSETQSSIPIVDGLFNVLLGAVNPLPTDLFSDEPRWLETEIEGEALHPRTELVSVGSAFRAHGADTAGYAHSANHSVWADSASWAPGGSGYWILTGEILHPTAEYALSRSESNVLYGAYDSTHVNLGTGCTTGAVGSDHAHCTVSGGVNNTSGGSFTTVGGGRANTATGADATIGGGISNTASGPAATVAGGSQNAASGSYSTCAGGISNLASGNYAAIGGGRENSATSSYSAVVGGYGDTVTGQFSFAAGQGVRVNANYTLAFGRDFTTSSSNSIVLHNSVTPMRVGIGAVAPTNELHVVGHIRMVDGNQANGKVLTSDANGVASWQSPGTGGADTVPYAHSLVTPCTVSSSSTSPILTVRNASTGHGISIPFAGGDGIHIGQADYGVRVDTTRSGYDGFHVERAADDGLDIWSAGDDGVWIGNCGDDGVYVGTASGDGIYVWRADYGVNADSVWFDGFHVRRSNDNGFRVQDAGENGMYVEYADEDGVRIDHAGSRGVYVGEAYGVALYGQSSEATAASFKNAKAGVTHATLQLDNDSTGAIINAYGGPLNSLRYQFTGSGWAYADGGWGTFKANEKGDYESFSAVVSPYAELVTHGTGWLVQGELFVPFDESFSQLASTEIPIRIVVTPKSGAGLYVPEQSTRGFTVRSWGGDPNCQFDWIAVAREKGHETRADVTHVRELERSARLKTEGEEDAHARTYATE